MAGPSHPTDAPSATAAAAEPTLRDAPRRVTRLAPSPTGALHLGNARTFLINYAMACQQGWRVVMRMEDLDTPRVKAGADTQAFDDLRWLGLQWEGDPLYQRADLAPYHHALTELWRQGRLYPCTCTRKEIEQAQSAPHAEDHELRYPGTCRPNEKATPLPSADADQPLELPFGDDVGPAAWRVIMPGDPVAFHDELHGDQCIDVQSQVGDFVVATKAGLPAYQLAVVVDDARQGVTDVVRGDDLLGATARQVWLYDVLRLQPRPRYWHLPLVIGEDGRRLAKRHGDTRIASYRDAGVKVERIVGLLAWWSGMTDRREPMATERFVAEFKLSRLPREAAVFTQEDHAWLTRS